MNKGASFNDGEKFNLVKKGDKKMNLKVIFGKENGLRDWRNKKK